MERKTPVHIDKELHKDIRITAAKLSTTIKKFVEMGARRLLAEFDDGLITERDFKAKGDNDNE